MHTTVLTTTRLHLLLALTAALTAVLTGTVYGAAAATAVLAVVVLRSRAAAHLDARTGGSGAAGAGVLAGPEHRGVLQRAGHPGQRPAH